MIGIKKQQQGRATRVSGQGKQAGLMERWRRGSWCVGVSALWGLGVMSGARAAEPVPTGAPMQKLARSYRTLLEKAVQFERDGKWRPEDAESVREQLKKMRQELKDLNVHQEAFGAEKDAGLPKVASRLIADLEWIDTLVEGGNHRFAAQSLRGVSQSCASCHTRSAIGPEFGDAGGPPSDWGPGARGDLALALRQYDLALSAYDEALKSPQVGALEKEQVVRSALLVLIRVRRSWDGTASWLKLAESQKGLSPSFLENLRFWRERAEVLRKRQDAVLTVSSEKSLSKSRTSPQSSLETRWKEVLKLQSYPRDHRADLDLLVLSQQAHDALNQVGGSTPQDKLSRAKILLKLGQIYQILQGARFQELPDTYLEACIRALPSAVGAPALPSDIKKQARDVGRQCYHTLEEEVTARHTGSAGVTELPREVSERLRELAGALNGL